MPADALHPGDEDVLDRFGRQAIGKVEWTHEMHLRVCWIHLRCHDVAGTIDRMRAGIRRLNEANDIVNSTDSGYHETLTRAWTRIVHAADAGDAEPANNSLAFVERHTELLDRRLPLKYYTRECITSTDARLGWIEPDLEPLPGRYSRRP